MTNTKAAANYLASKGRHGDSTLVHMSPIEVWALERMSPEGKLSRNPETGMPEAFSLGSLLPAVAGLGASMLFPGAGLLLPALISGGTSYAMTGNLGQGLMSGLLSYGLGSALNAASGATDAGSQALAESTKTAAATAPQAAAAATPAIPGAQLGGALTSGAAPSAFGNFGLSSSYTPPADLMSGAFSGAAPVSSAVSGAASPAITTSSSLGSKLGAAMSNLQSDPGGTLSRTFIDNFKSTTLPIAGSVLGSMALEPQQPFTPVQGSLGPSDKELQRRYPERFPQDPGVRFPGSDYIPGTSGEFDYFANMASGGEAKSLMANPDAVYAKGGIADPDGAKASKANIEAEAKMALLDHHPRADEALARYERAFGPEALQSLRQKIGVAGGRIRGAGGGLDDLIPGTIEGRRDVRLADGEFVVPADVVSMLGDGSSDHGVRKLHEMMDRVRLQKTGTKKQAKPLKDGGALPA